LQKTASGGHVHAAILRGLSTTETKSKSIAVGELDISDASFFLYRTFPCTQEEEASGGRIRRQNSRKHLSQLLLGDGLADVLVAVHVGLIVRCAALVEGLQLKRFTLIGGGIRGAGRGFP
jgi:hypothetical protein